jgi:hypothetical protein
MEPVRECGERSQAIVCDVCGMLLFFRSFLIALMMEALRTCETLVNYENTRLSILAYFNVHTRHLDNLKVRLCWYICFTIS